MAVNLSPIGGVAGQFFDNNGDPLTGGKIYTYAAGTTTPSPTYTTSGGTTPHPNPIILDAAGRVPSGEIWLTDGAQYKFVIKTSTDVQIGSYDNIIGINSNFVNYTNSQEIQTATAGQTVFTLTTMQYQPGTNSLSVFVDGVNQYGPGSSYAYTETSSTVVTFSSGLHVGAQVKFTTSAINASSYGDAEQVSYNPPFTGGAATNVEAKLAQTVSVKDFGAVGDGVADDTAAIQAALSAHFAVYVPSGTYKVSSTLNLQAGSVLFGDGSTSEITCANGDISIIYGLSTDNCAVKNLKINVTVAGTSGYIGAVHFATCQNCRVENVEIEGVTWAGVYLDGSSYCYVTGVYAHDWRGTEQDSADICVYRASSYNIIDGNFCFGNGWHGIFVQEPTAGQIPLKNVISNNRIGAHKTYGIAVYSLSSVDVFTQIIGNTIEDIDGATLTGNAGAGMYINNVGAVTVTGNTVRNCCLSTSGLTLAPGGISFNNIVSTLTPCVVSGNVIQDIKNYFGIVVTSSPAGVSITGNSISLDVNAAATSVGVYINASSNCVVSSNTISLPNPLGGSGISVYANGVNTSNNVISNNTILGGIYSGIEFERTAAFVNNNATVTGNRVSGGTSANICYRLNAIVNGVVSGNFGAADTTNACTVSNSTGLRLTGNNFTTTGTRSFVTAGTCTGSYYDKTNYSGSAITFIQNVATGLIVEVLNNAAPASSNWAVGDRVEQSVPVVGQPKGWRCTVAGVPGTWVSEGNL